jgi:hypothetical protein
MKQVGLDTIALRHGTDKASGPGGHNFAAIYESFFKPLRNQRIRLLEIGVESGASLRTWEEYFPNAEFVGIDINPAAKEQQTSRSVIYLGDQADTEFLFSVAHVYEWFDIVIDDGGHFARQQLTSLHVLWQHVTPGGIYAIEDIHTSYLEDWEGGWRKEGTTVEWLKEIVDDVNHAWHGQPATMPDLSSLHLYPELAILVKQSR